MAGHLEVDKKSQPELLKVLKAYADKKLLHGLTPFRRYKDGELTWQLLTDRNEDGDYCVLTVYPWTFEFPNEPNVEDRTETNCIAEIHLSSIMGINKIYLVK
jgi:hypothetical protein